MASISLTFDEFYEDIDYEYLINKIFDKSNSLQKQLDLFLCSYFKLSKFKKMFDINKFIKLINKNNLIFLKNDIPLPTKIKSIKILSSKVTFILNNLVDNKEIVYNYRYPNDSNLIIEEKEEKTIFKPKSKEKIIKDKIIEVNINYNNTKKYFEKELELLEKIKNYYECDN